MKAILYARYSTEHQSAASVEDQFRICRERAHKESWTVIAEHGDDAVSGTTPVQTRRGGKALVADMTAGRFDVLIVEGLDRLSRDQVQQETLIRRMERAGIRIVGVSDGYDSQQAGRKLMRGVRGLFNELFLDDLRAKTHRGQTGKVLGGYVAGGKSYGYRLVRHLDGDRSVGSTYEVDEEEASWVRWIFARHAEGMAVRGIAHALNQQHVPSPRGGSWGVSAIYGSPNKGSGILNNALYVGRYVWNRSQWTKDPDTGIRQRMERPRSEWHEQMLPELRLIDDDLWAQVRLRIDAGRDAHGRKAQHRPPSALFSGIIRCPHCGGRLTVLDATYYGCGRAKDRGPTVCKGFRIRKSIVDSKLVTVLRDQLLSPAAAREFAAAVSEEMTLQNATPSEMDSTRDRLKTLRADIERLVDAIASGGHSAALLNRLDVMEREATTLNDLITPKMTKHPTQPLPAFKEVLQNLNQVLSIDTQGARHLIAELLGEIVIEQRDDEVWAHIATDRLLKLAAGQPLTDNVVAGTGFEPVTFGL